MDDWITRELQRITQGTADRSFRAGYDCAVSGLTLMRDHIDYEQARATLDAAIDLLKRAAPGGDNG